MQIDNFQSFENLSRIADKALCSGKTEVKVKLGRSAMQALVNIKQWRFSAEQELSDYTNLKADFANLQEEYNYLLESLDEAQ